MSERLKRPWFQIHLSTVVVMTVVAGILIWANMRHWADRNYMHAMMGIPAKAFGWPVEAAWFKSLKGDGTNWIILFPSGTRIFPMSSEAWWKVYFPNMATAGVILVCAGLCCEYLIRRRERKGTP